MKRIVLPSVLAVFYFLMLSYVNAADQSLVAGQTIIKLDGQTVEPTFGTMTGFWFFAKPDSPQVVMMGHPTSQAVIEFPKAGTVTIEIGLPAKSDFDGVQITEIIHKGANAQLKLSAKGASTTFNFPKQGTATGSINNLILPQLVEIKIESKGPATFRLGKIGLIKKGEKQPTGALVIKRRQKTNFPVQSSPRLLPAIVDAQLECDWRMADGIGTSREPVSYATAIKKLFRQGDLLVDDLQNKETDLGKTLAKWNGLKKDFKKLSADNKTTEPQWQSLWLAIHRTRRALVFKNPLADTGPLLFSKRVPSIMSHQLTQCYGYTSQPGGGLFVLDQPGQSIKVRCLTGSMKSGSFLRPEVTFDGQTIYFPYCKADTAPEEWGDPKTMDRWFHIWSMKADGSDLKQLTDGPFDDLNPICLPDGQLMFPSTRRGGFHRCGRGPCYVYTLAIAGADGSDPHPVSFHETNEWDPTIGHDGRVIYTRWDYVDRNAVYYQQLWSVRQDGSDVRIFYGNNTFNPPGIWEAHAVPGSNKVMATAAAHHGMSAGSIILLNVTEGVDGPKPIQRLTPDALIPESEAPLAHSAKLPEPLDFDYQPQRFWEANFDPNRNTKKTIEQRRWPGHCYKAPYPLSEDYFLASYSYDRLLGEPGPNRPNMFGLYLVDSFGNRELLYRDPNISSQWVIPLKARKKPIQTPTTVVKGPDGKQSETGTFFLQNVYESWPKLPNDKVTHLRIIQVLPKTTPNINQPKVGLPFASPGKQVLGTVPVEEDGSAYFTVPAKTPILFQALDEQGRAVQTMRSLTYLQPGEKASCVGCHESRMSTPPVLGNPIAIGREPSKITPGPDGSNPLSYPILVQPVLDKHCVECHNAKKPEGKVILTGEPAGQFSQSYNHLAPLVAYTAWYMPNRNYEPLTHPGQFGARNSQLVKLLDAGHYDVKLSDAEWERLVTWIEANALFYGTFNVKDQAKQQKGERITGPDLE
jgi:Hydrazine synthase alpha subunit middle domain